jgi:two-component system response regulator HydG
LPETLLEAELFGHEKGAFTGALRQRRGRFELAHRGTLFLDESGEISPVVQVKLLRVLQERKFERVGGNETIDVDVRLVCATQKDLRKEVSMGRFREDLFYRLNVVQVVIPPLRKRQEDIMVIADHVLQSCSVKMNKKLKGFSPVSRELLLRYSFPGNVRELENMVERAVALGRDREPVQPQDLCGFQTCPYTGGVPQDTCGFCSEGLTGQRGRSARPDSLMAAREEFERSTSFRCWKKWKAAARPRQRYWGSPEKRSGRSASATASRPPKTSRRKTSQSDADETQSSLTPTENLRFPSPETTPPDCAERNSFWNSLRHGLIRP